MFQTVFLCPFFCSKPCCTDDVSMLPLLWRLSHRLETAGWFPRRRRRYPGQRCGEASDNAFNVAMSHAPVTTKNRHANPHAGSPVGGDARWSVPRWTTPQQPSQALMTPRRYVPKAKRNYFPQDHTLGQPVLTKKLPGFKKFAWVKPIGGRTDIACLANEDPSHPRLK